jgi:hypothetical protein
VGQPVAAVSQQVGGSAGPHMVMNAPQQCVTQQPPVQPAAPTQCYLQPYPTGYLPPVQTVPAAGSGGQFYCLPPGQGPVRSGTMSYTLQPAVIPAGYAGNPSGQFHVALSAASGGYQPVANASQYQTLPSQQPQQLPSSVYLFMQPPMGAVPSGVGASSMEAVQQRLPPPPSVPPQRSTAQLQSKSEGSILRTSLAAPPSAGTPQSVVVPSMSSAGGQLPAPPAASSHPTSSVGYTIYQQGPTMPVMRHVNFSKQRNSIGRPAYRPTVFGGGGSGNLRPAFQPRFQQPNAAPFRQSGPYR